MTIGLESAATSFGCVACTGGWIALGVVGEGEGEGEGEDRESCAEGTTGDGERGGWRYWLYTRCSGVLGDPNKLEVLAAGGVAGGEKAGVSANAEEVRECRFD